MSWSKNNRYGYAKDHYDSEGNDLRGGADEYTTQYCHSCSQKTEHDICTGACVECHDG